MKVLVFDVGGTMIKYSVMDEDLNKYQEGEVETPSKDREEFLKALEDIYHSCGDGVEGITMSLPGVIDSERGYCRSGGYLTFNARHFLAQELKERLHCDVYLENDGKCAALAEMWRGVLKGCSDAAVFIIGTGVGGGLVLNGKLHKGKDFSAGEFSYVCVNPEKWSEMDYSMSMTCSTLGLMKKYKEEKGMDPEASVNGKQFFQMLYEEDPVAVRLFEQFCKNIAIEIYNLTMLLDLEKVAIGGGISAQDILLEKINESLDWIYENNPRNTNKDNLPKAQVVRCAYGSEANQVGALYHYLMKRDEAEK